MCPGIHPDAETRVTQVLLSALLWDGWAYLISWSRRQCSPPRSQSPSVSGDKHYRHLLWVLELPHTLELLVNLSGGMVSKYMTESTGFSFLWSGDNKINITVCFTKYWPRNFACKGWPCMGGRTNTWSLGWDTLILAFLSYNCFHFHLERNWVISKLSILQLRLSLFLKSLT